MKQLLVFGMLALLLLTGCTAQEQSSGVSPQPPSGSLQANGSAQPSGESPQTVSGSISAAEFAKHGDNSSCWVLYDGKVYDVTSFLQVHKKDISALCGKSDGSFANAFEGQHGLTKVETLKQVGTLQGDYSG
jgi:hypothetical protein